MWTTKHDEALPEAYTYVPQLSLRRKELGDAEPSLQTKIVDENLSGPIRKLSITENDWRSERAGSEGYW